MLKSPFAQHHRPNWSFDDSAIISAIYGDKHTDIYSINIADASTKRLTYDGARYGVMTSQTTLLYTKLKRGLWQKNINNIDVVDKVIDGNFFNTLYAWTYDEGHVYYQQTFDDHHQLIAYDITEKIQTPLLRLPMNSISQSDSITYLSTKDRLLYTSSSYPQANIKMIPSKNLF